MAIKESYENFRKSRWFPLIIGVVYVVFGILCLVNPEAKMESIAMLIGIAILLAGLIQILSGIVNRADKKSLVSNMIIGVVLVVLAILVFVNLELMGKYLPTIFGFMMVLSGLSSLLHSITMYRAGVKNWWINAVIAVIVLVLGIVFIANPGFVGQAIGIFTGIVLLINGLSNLISFVLFK